MTDKEFDTLINSNDENFFVTQDFTNEVFYNFIKKLGKTDKLPKTNGTYRRHRSNVTVIQKFYEYFEKFCLDYPIDIEIPKVGRLKVYENDSVSGKYRFIHTKDGMKEVIDTPFISYPKFRLKLYKPALGSNTPIFAVRPSKNKFRKLLKEIAIKRPTGGFYLKVN